MPQSLSSILIHLIFSTKNREPFLTPEIDAELYPYMAAIFKALNSPALPSIFGSSVQGRRAPLCYALAPGYHIARLRR